MIKKSDYYYNLPEELIAQTPIERRDESRLMVIDRASDSLKHDKFKNIENYLSPGDTLVLNDTKVMPARLYGSRIGKEEEIEVLLLNRVEDAWECIVRPGKKMKVGSVVNFSDVMTGEVISIKDDGNRIIKFTFDGIFEEVLDKLGEMPLPPYIHEKLKDRDRYQTVYAREVGSAAAPTAGLHFTRDLLEDLKRKGINIAYLTLHVGLGTFRPVKEDNVLNHHMHEEYYYLDEANAKIIIDTKNSGGRIISVGTTSTRTLESIYKKHGKIIADSGYTDIFIYPGFEFNVIDGLITNFHLPESTLLMLISAFYDREKILGAYEVATMEKYRFFSFGDAMFIY